MSNTTTRRIIAGASAAAIAAGVAVTMGAGAASAAADTTTGSSDGWKYSRTVSNTTPKPGDVINVSNSLTFTALRSMYTTGFTESYDPCLTYVENSARVNGKGVGVTGGGAGADSVTLTGSWFTDAASAKSKSYSLSYTVGENCARDVALNFDMSIAAGQGLGTSKVNIGPSITIAKNATSVSLAPVVASEVNVPVDLTATVRGSANGDSVGFFVDGVQVGTGHTNASGVATYRWTPTTAGNNKSAVAKFAGTAFANPSESGAQTFNVSAANVDSSVSLNNPVDARVGIAIPLTATVSPAGAGGSVAFFEGNTELARVNVGGDGTATYAYQATAHGPHTITAKFSGRDGVRGSQTSQTFTVAEKAPDTTDTTTVLTAPATGTVGTPTELKVQVTGASTGTVTFKDGQNIIATVPMQSNGFASTMWTPSVDGERTITAEYSGAGTVNGSSDAKTVDIAPKPGVDPGPGDGGGGGGGGGTSSLASLGTLFGSLGG